MKKALLVLLLAASVHGQGLITFSTRSIPKTDASQGTYDVPVWRCSGGVGVTGVGGGYVACLYGGTASPQNPMAPIVKALFRDTTSTQFLLKSRTVVAIPGVLPGERATLTLVIWEGFVGNTNVWRAEATFQSPPLGGSNANGIIFPTPGLTGLGPENGSGLVFCYDAPPEWIPCLPLKLSTIQADSTLQVSWPTCVGVKYQVQGFSQESSWTNVGAIFIGDSYWSGRNVAMTNGPSGFFRVVTVP